MKQHEKNGNKAKITKNDTAVHGIDITPGLCAGIGLGLKNTQSASPIFRELDCHN